MRGEGGAILCSLTSDYVAYGQEKRKCHSLDFHGRQTVECCLAIGVLRLRNK